MVDMEGKNTCIYFNIETFPRYRLFLEAQGPVTQSFDVFLSAPE